MNIDELNQQGSTLFSQGKYSEAKHLFKRVLRANPRNVPALIGLAFVLTLLDQTDECQTLLSSAFEDAPSEALWIAAQYLVMVGQFDEARRNLIELINTDREAAEKADLWYLLGFSCVMVEDIAGAERYLQMATQLNPDNGRYWHNLGWTLKACGKGADASEAFERARELDYERPTDRPAW